MIKGQKSVRTESVKVRFFGGGGFCHSNQYCRNFGIAGLTGKVQRRGYQLS